MRKLIPFFIILILPLIILLVWFRNGNILGGGESGLYFYNLSRTAYITGSTWADPALGNVIGVGVAGNPMHLTFSWLQKAGISSVLIQAVFYWLLFVIPALSIYFLTKELFPSLKNNYLILSVFFYWFNPASMINVWNRNLDNYRVFYAFIPLAFYLYLLGLRKRRTVYGVLTSISAGIFSYALTGTPFHILLWLVILYITIFHLVLDKSKAHIFFVLKYFAVTFTFFLLINFWWLSQFFAFIFSPSFVETTSKFFTIDGNLGTLTALSEKLGQMADLLRLTHGTFFLNSSSWWQVFATTPLVFLSFILVFPVFWAIYQLSKNREVVFLGTLFILLLFLAKGNNPPLGELFEIVFIRISYLQVFRNAFEKFSFLLPVAAAPLFAIGISKLTEAIHVKKVAWLVYSAFTLILLGMYGFPYWTGLIITRIDPNDSSHIFSLETEVPEYYQAANQWFNDQVGSGNYFRFLTLPINGEGIDYAWKTPYAGVELSATLFDVPNISFNTSISFYENIAGNIERIIFTRHDWQKLASLLNLRYVLIRDDIEWRVRQMTNPDIVQEHIEADETLKKVASFDSKLAIYSVGDNVFMPKIWASSTGISVYPSSEIEDLIISQGEVGDFIFTGQADQGEPEGLAIAEYKTLVKPQVILQTGKYQPYTVDTALVELLHVSHLPTEPLYLFARIKEQLERSTIREPDQRYLFDLTHLGKRMVEAYKLSVNNQTKDIAQKSVATYIASLEKLINMYPSYLIPDSSGQHRDITVRELRKHLTILSAMGPDFSDELTKLRTLMIDAGIIARNEVLLSSPGPNQRYWVYSFAVPKEDKYTIIIENNRWEDFYTNLPRVMDIQIDSEVSKVNVEYDNDYLSFGEMHLSKGIHEIIIEEPESLSLVKFSPHPVEINSDTVPQVTFPIFPFDSFSSYDLSVDYLIEEGYGFELTAKQDNDPLNDKGIIYPYKRSLTKDSYSSGYKNESWNLVPKHGGQSLELLFKVRPYNICPEERQKPLLLISSCLDDQFAKQFDRKTRITLKNVNATRAFNNRVFLLAGNIPSENHLPVTAFTKISPAEYRVSVQDAQSPYVLIFSELFNSSWEARFEDGSKIGNTQHFLVNGYANGWFIDRPGEYIITLKFLPEDILPAGKILSLASLGIALVVVIVLLKKRT